MYSFYDYFDPERRTIPYRREREELEDYLRLLDMVLERCLEYKGLGKEKKLFSRGLVITESEMENYFGMPPYFRERDICDPELAAATEEAWEYIDERLVLTLGLTNEILGTAMGEDDSDEEGFLGDDVPGDDSDEEGSLGEELLGDDSDEEGSLGNDFLGDDSYGDDSYGDDSEEDGPDEDDMDEAPLEIGVFWIESLRSIFKLDNTGVMALLLALSVEIDRRYERIYGFLQDDISKTKPTVGLLAMLMGRMTSREEAEDLQIMPLDEDLFSSLFVKHGNHLGLDTPLILNPFMRRILLGLPDTDEALSDALQIYREEDGIPVFFETSAAEISKVLEEETRFLYVESTDEDTVLHLLDLYCVQRRIPLFVLDLGHFQELSDDEQDECLAELSLRMRLGSGQACVRLVRNPNREIGMEKEFFDKRWKLLNRISRAVRPGCIVIFGEAEEPGELIVKSVPFVRIPAPDVMTRMDIWSHFLQEDENVRIAGDVVIPDLADCYNISYGMIRNTCSHAKADAEIRQNGVVDRELILDALRQLNQVDFSGLASYVRAVYSWDDITITDDQRSILKVACDRYRLRNRIGKGWGLTGKNAYGNGVSLLLYGPPGTGKTMSAQVVARELGLPLYRVDISQIFSKYIGETEKNLSVIFDAAKGANVILFFDEADALFSKRTDISNSNDKYSNSETAYLLQKIEEYDGMSILATNHYANFDPAFVRRITYSVRLDSPDEEARYILWTTILPPQTEISEDVDFRFFANRFELSGANIKAILYSAAYMAGASGEAVSSKHIVRAMEYEFRKLGRFIARESFGKYAAYFE